MPWLGGWSPGSVEESVRTAPDTGTPCPHGGGQSYVEEAVEGEKGELYLNHWQGLRHKLKFGRAEYIFIPHVHAQAGVM